MVDYKVDTLLAHVGINADEKTGALVSPIHLSTTYQHPEFGQSTGFDYTRTKNPTRANLEKTLAAIEQADYALVTSSGMAALVLLFSGFPVGSRIVAARDLYGGSFRWFNEQEANGRFTFTYATNEEELLAQITDETDYVFIETPTNPLMVEFDITRVAEVAHAHGAKFIVDNTFYSPIYQNPIPLGADVVLHSATKYLSGHNDVLAGVLVTNDQILYDKLFYDQNTTGPTLSPFDAYLLMRGLKTLSLRMERSTKNAQKIVDYLRQSPAVREVYYTGKGGMVSVKVLDEQKIPIILNQLKVFTFAESLGGVESLITYPATQTHADIPAEVRHSYGLTDDLLRLSIGIEDAEDLIDDLKQALEDD
ncbi:cystathionine gamma-synthase [Streptococcus sp. zg-86]|uniref:homocysteine desulfhydrase n=1 Tax=Streptococcus zhangguiae TaxID=2664091 RepID=A0A6I4RTX1_9STRE|nr:MULTISPECIES: cystathionine gamma-synthase [unclassified Streptococcus]MTB64485.1 cystathionine gamma-synthase [Streptococcus sp. zg-86]MTB90825.1 cystathionine gamma-synthase [Streptococcus sp. zg-36]MWV56472.1 cystathionine gamma-synthase [Streptococcus sp. zg-70]QTH47321.1 cystathionine gamma-synthase [Streptococcus sp. zg-86]